MPWPKGKPFPPDMVAKRVASFMAGGKKAKKPRVVDGRECWRCSACHAWLPSERFYPDRRARNGLKPQCRSCHCECIVRTRDPVKQADRNRDHMRRARAKDPEKFRARARSRPRRTGTPEYNARAALNAAVRRGNLTRPATCPMCGKPGRIEGHHHDYAKPLDVTWLCATCHGLEHRGTLKRKPRRLP